MPFFATLAAVAIPAIISGGAAIGSALIGKSTADKNAQQQQAASAKIDAYGAPYRAAGTNALGDLQTAYGEGDPNTLAARTNTLSTNFKNSPLYQMTYQPAVDQAMLEEQRMGSSRGDLNGGRTLMAIQDRAARLGGQTFGNYLQGITGLATGGQNAAFGSGNQMQQGQNALSSYNTQGGDALGAGVLGLGSAAVKGGNNYNYLAGQSSYAPPPAAPQYAARGQPLY